MNTITCSYCSKSTFKDNRAYQVHLAKTHPNEYQLEKVKSKESYQFKCPRCDERFKTYKGLQGHCSLIHKIKGGQELYMTYYNLSEIPKCKCGCGQNVSFGTSNFHTYIRGHVAKVNGGFYTEQGARKSAETRRKLFDSGELHAWNKGKKYTEEQYNKILAGSQKPERRAKISKALSGKPKSKEHIAKITADRKKYWGDRTHQLEQRERRMQYIIKHGLGHSSKLEKEFETILDSLGIKYYTQFYAKDIKALYDFKLRGKNILIEVDGDYWHCNPNLEEYKEPKLQWHFDNIERDKIKNSWAQDNGYQLIRFWEHDIKNNRLVIIQKLLDLVAAQ